MYGASFRGHEWPLFHRFFALKRKENNAAWSKAFPLVAGVPVPQERGAKKLRYMSKIAAIFARSDNTRLSCTQPIGNLVLVRL
jgi:hypothetical protein